MKISRRQEPSLIVIAGPNGSGKTTLVEEGYLTELGLAVPEHSINPDAITKALRESRPDADQKDLEYEGFHAARALRETYREQQLSFSLETVFSHPSTFLDIKKCRAAGYTITLIYVTTEKADINVARVAGRVRHGGHAVEEKKIRERYERSLSYLPRMVEEADHAVVFDTTFEGPMRRCFTKRRFITQDNPPEYLVRRLITPLEQRRNDRTELLALFSTASLPDEEAGVYLGPIVDARASFAVQQTAENVLFLHDLLLFRDAALFTGIATSGVPVRIQHTQGEGSLENL